MSSPSAQSFFSECQALLRFKICWRRFYVSVTKYFWCGTKPSF